MRACRWRSSRCGESGGGGLDKEGIEAAGDGFKREAGGVRAARGWRGQRGPVSGEEDKQGVEIIVGLMRR